ncbi:MAG TPA: sulfite exporter TauE/SafE family protein [Bryobacteraceae bacterium]|nr:sulfite exporter TauE/SafE family protein [Bryobacteraceae bacterium]
MFEALLTVVAFLAGGIASVAGFGIGAILTPVFALAVGTKAAVAVVSLPHLAGTLVRFWLVRGHVDRTVLIHFGLVSAAGAFAGAMLHGHASNPLLAALLSALLIATGVAGMAGRMEGRHFGRTGAWVAGVVSGLLGGLVGNQGGIRSAALLGFKLKRDAFLATTTAVGLIVDAARIPLYISNDSHFERLWLPALLMTAGVLAGTLLGARLLRRIPEAAFRRIVSGVVLALGLFLAFRVAS